MASVEMKRSKIFFVLALCVLYTSSVTSSKSSSQHDLGDSRLAIDKWKSSRRSYCVGSPGKCFSTGQCCEGLVCAAIDDYVGQKPEVPGYCVIEKDLQTCTASSDCETGSRCVALGRTGERYCLPKSKVKNMIEQQVAEPVDKSPFSLKQSDKLSGLGSQCETNADCKSASDVTNIQLCCQDVRRGRQGVRRICDRVTGISICLD